jgi:hypothetical protein
VRRAAVIVAQLFAWCAVSVQAGVADRVLFVGNSLTYYNDVPRIVASMLAATDHPIKVDMLASGGATMADHLREGQLAKLLDMHAYDVVVLQDLGGFPACDDTFPGCKQAIASVCEAVKRVRDAGARPILFGTWQSIPVAQRELSGATHQEAVKCDVAVADVGAAMQCFTARVPSESPWLKDGHPTLAGSWIAASVVARAIAGRDLCVDVQIVPVCRLHWQGAELSSASLASAQPQPTRDCGMPPEDVMRAAIKSANAATN